LETPTLLQETLKFFTIQIPSEALTQTFMDAIWVAQTLGMDYIWIDSLCIIQDSPDDWAIESAKMGDVYGNSYLNIAATRAADGSQGLFRIEHDHRNQSFRASPSTQGRNKMTYHSVPLLLYQHSMLEAPLSRRAWVVQERLLSRRTVHFTSSGIFWECMQSNACEAFRDKIPGMLCFDDNTELTSFAKQPFQDYKWEHIVFFYTKCNLSFTRDKIPAISGVGQRMAMLKNCSFVFGHLRDESFPLQLCWRRSDGFHDNLTTTRPKIWRAPSWSWAAIDCAVAYNWTNIDSSYNHAIKIYPYIEITDSPGNIAAPSSSRFSSNAILRINCVFLLRKFHRADRWDSRQWRIDRLAVRATAVFDYPPNLHDSFYLLPISKSALKDPPEDKALDSLILRKTGRKNGQYQRMGYLKLELARFKHEQHFCFDEKMFCPRLEAGTLGNEDPLRPEDYVKEFMGEESKFRYQIELV